MMVLESQGGLLVQWLGWPLATAVFILSWFAIVMAWSWVWYKALRR